MEHPAVIAAVVTSLCTLAGVIYNGVVTLRTHKETKATNRAVNNKKPHQMSLYEMAVDNHSIAKELLEWKRSYDESPWNNGDGVNSWLDGYHERLKALEDKIPASEEDE